MDEDRKIDLRRTKLMDFVMEASLGSALAAFVIFNSVFLTLGVLCAVWLGGMAVLNHIG
jgi:hypothetical protein